MRLRGGIKEIDGGRRGQTAKCLSDNRGFLRSEQFGGELVGGTESIVCLRGC